MPTVPHFEATSKLALRRACPTCPFDEHETWSAEKP
jgi:hypothetical protein